MKGTTPGREPGEDLDVSRVHGQIWREHPEPTEQVTTAPWWLKHLVYAPLLIWGIWYLFAQSAGFRWDEYVEGPLVTPPPGGEVAGEAGAVSQTDPVAEGQKTYAAVCAVCHQANGEGLPGAFPPLAGSDWVLGDPARPVLVVLYGLQGPIEVNGRSWNSVMPAQGPNLDDEKVAQVLSYVRGAWGNDAGPVEADLVQRLRSEHEGRGPWTAEALEEALKSQ